MDMTFTLHPGDNLQGGKYRIEKVLGQGGFGITYLAIQGGLDRTVAIKEFFMREACCRASDSRGVTLGTEGNRETVDRYRQKFLKEARSMPGSTTHTSCASLMCSRKTAQPTM